MERALTLVSHQDFHLANWQVLDVFVLGASFLYIGLAAETNWFVLFFKDPRALDGECAPLLSHAGRRLQALFPRRGCARAWWCWAPKIRHP